jgi:hypothetical protein
LPMRITLLTEPAMADLLGTVACVYAQRYTIAWG